MKYTERVAEYEFTTVDYPNSTMYSFLLNTNLKATLWIESREYAPQKRTIKVIGAPFFNTQYLSFPIMRFSKYIIRYNVNFIDFTVHFYHISAEETNSDFIGIPKVASISKSGLVCLGEKTKERYVNYNLPVLTMDEFVDEFWTTKFLTPITHQYGVVKLTDSLRLFPDVWSDLPISNIISNEFIKI